MTCHESQVALSGLEKNKIMLFIYDFILYTFFLSQLCDLFRFLRVKSLSLIKNLEGNMPLTFRY